MIPLLDTKKRRTGSETTALLFSDFGNQARIAHVLVTEPHITRNPFGDRNLTSPLAMGQAKGENSCNRPHAANWESWGNFSRKAEVP